jgi:hypothetical protein
LGYCIREADDSEPHTADSVPHTADSVPHTADTVPHTADSVPHTDDSVPHTDDSVLCNSRAGRAANMIEILRNKSRKAEIN